MKQKKTTVFFFGLAILICILLVFDILNSPNTNQLKGGFQEIASYRNENNTGPVQRIYAVAVNDVQNAEFESYGKLMPHTKYGNTKVYFFKKGENIPTELYPGDYNFDSQFFNNCIALFEKGPMGSYNVTLDPFQDKQVTQRQKNQ